MVCGETNAVNEETMLPYFYWLNCIRSIGFKDYVHLFERYCTPREIYEANLNTIRAENLLNEKQIEQFEEMKRHMNPQKEYDKLVKSHIQIIPYGAVQYPDVLHILKIPPVCIYTMGHWIWDDGPKVAVIGARSCSVYGRRVARLLGESLAKNQVTVISGMALGIDSVSQQAAMDEGGYSIGVLGCSVNICYPLESKAVYEQLKTNGCILSEFPPNTPPKKQYFPMRNRIISALADAVVVVEAQKKSGTLITVDWAIEQNKDVYAVPGRIDAPESDGCNELIRQGAQMLNDVKEFIADITGEKKEQIAISNCIDKIRESAVLAGETKWNEETYILELTKENFLTPEEIFMKISDLGIGRKGELKMSDIYEECVNLCMDGKLISIGGNRFGRA